VPLTSVADEQQLDEVDAGGACGGPFDVIAGPEVAGLSSPGPLLAGLVWWVGGVRREVHGVAGTRGRREAQHDKWGGARHEGHGVACTRGRRGGR
jgi:hypothetical protein